MMAGTSREAVWHGIAFSAPMIRALLDDRKHQTRRVLNPGKNCKWGSIGPQMEFDLNRAWVDNGFGDQQYLHVPFKHKDDWWEADPADDTLDRLRPIWRVGDRIWVREACAFINQFGASLSIEEARSRQHKITILYKADEPPYLYDTGQVEYMFEGGAPVGQIALARREASGIIWKPPMFMPRWACRIHLEITDVRCQRINDISESDAMAEGVRFFEPAEADVQYCYVPGFHDKAWADFGLARDAFQDYWNHLHWPKHPWSSNDWVAALSFRRIECQKT